MKKTKICEICNNTYSKAYVTGTKGEKNNKCSYRCYIEYKTKQNESNIDLIKCELCEYKNKNLRKHIINIHQITLNEYKNQFPNSNYISNNTLNLYSKSMQGEKNPGYQHGGTLSPFSKKSLYHNEEKRLQAKLKKEQSVKNHPENQTTTLEYWLNKGFSLEEAKLLQSERQKTFSKEICITKHGIEKGLKIWNERQIKWQETLNNKSDEEKARINRLKVTNGISISKAEKEIFEILNNKIKIEKQFTLYYENKRYFIYDLKFNNKIIEYNGDYWHANPIKYKRNDILNFPRKSIKAKRIWEKDKKKIELAESQGYEVLVIWENDYKKNKEETIKKCINFLTI